MRTKQTVTLLLLFAFLISTLAVLTSCGGDPTPPNRGKPLEGDGWYSEVDFHGETLRIDQSTMVSPLFNTIDSGAMYTMGPDEKGEDEVQNLCYDRNKTVEATLNLTLEYHLTSQRYDRIQDYYDPLFATNSVPDLIINDINPVVPMALNGQLVNVKNQNSEKYGRNYFNFDVRVGEDKKKCWYNDFMEGLTIDESKMYAVAGDYFLDMLRMAHCLYMNTEIFESSVVPALGKWDSLQSFYDYIANRDFTYHDLAIMSEVAWIDNGRQEGIADIGDRVGFLCHVGSGLFPFIYGADLEIVQKGSDGLQMNADTYALNHLTEKLLTVVGSIGTLQQSGEIWDELRDKFTANEALFVNTFWMGDLEHTDFRSMENKSAIVYPMADPSQGEYNTHVHYFAEIGYIPVDLLNHGRFSKVSAFLQLSCELSSSVIDVYFNEALKYGENTDAAAVPMLDVIHDTIGSSFIQIIVHFQITDYETADADIYDVIKKGVVAMQDKSTEVYMANFYAYEAGLAVLVEKFEALE